MRLVIIRRDASLASVTLSFSGDAVTPAISGCDFVGVIRSTSLIPRLGRTK